jgi:hypothetical protein
MTLDEYIAQEDAERFPNVVLKPEEYTVGDFIGIAPNRVRVITITHEGFNKEFSKNEYALKENDKTLYVIDRDGNPRKRSCFNIQ